MLKVHNSFRRAKTSSPGFISVTTLLVTVLLAIGTSTETRAAAGSSIYRKLLPKTVWIVIKNKDGISWGSGFVAAKTATSYYIVTNHHVVADSRSPMRGAFVAGVTVYHPKSLDGKVVNDRSRYLASKWGVNGSVLYTRPDKDLAIVGVAGQPPEGAWPYDKDTDFIPMRSVQPGDEVFGIGNPSASGGLWTYSSGEVRQSYQKYGREIVETTSPINPGDSGGPLVDKLGRIVGVNTSYRINARLVSHAVAASEVRSILNLGKSHGWFWLNNLNDVASGRYPAVISYYENVGNLFWAEKKAQEYVKRLRQEGKSTEKWAEKSVTLATLRKSTGKQCYVRFWNKTKETITVSYRIYSLTGDLSEYKWYPGTAGRSFTLRLKPNQAEFIRGTDGTPVPVRRITYSARGSKGGRWSQTTSNFEVSDKVYSNFGTSTQSFSG